MPHLKSFINIDGHNLTFYFNRITTHEGVFYYISVVDAKGETHIFYMKYAQDKWVLTDKQDLAEWVLKLEPKLSGMLATKKST